MKKASLINEPDIAGYLQVKRKMFWVIRYAEIINGTFYYYYNKGDSKPRGVFTLYGSKSSELLNSDNDQIIQFTSSKQQQSQRLLIRCENHQIHRNWLHKLNYFSQHQIQQQQNITVGVRNTDSDTISSTMSYMLRNQNNNIGDRSETESILNLESSNRQKQPHLRPNERKRVNDDLSQNLFIQVQYDNCKANPYVFDNEFLTEKQGGSGTNLLFQKNLLTALEHFKDCKILTDIDKNIRLFCSQSAIDASYNQEKSQRTIPQNPAQDQQGFFSQLASQYFDSPQMKIAMVFVTIMVSLIIYQGLQILDLKNLIITVLIVLNLILVPLLARKLNEMTYHSQKKKMKQIKQGVIAEYYFPHNVNEILFALTRHFEKRKEWQLTVQKCEPKPLLSSNEYITTYYRGEPEVFVQSVIRDKDVVYLTEQSPSQNFLRIFQMDANSQQEEGTTIKYYCYSPYTKIADMNNNPNSPILLYGINFYLKQLKRNPFSSLYTYYSQSGYTSNSTLVSNNISTNNQVINKQQKTIDIPQPDNNVSENTNASSKNLVQVQNGQENRNQKEQEIKVNENVNQNKQKEEQEQEEEESKVDVPQTSQDQIQLLEGENGKKYNEKIKELIKLMQSQVSLDPSNKWKESENKPDYKTHTKIDEATGNVMSRGEVIIKKAPQVIVDYIQDATKRKTWDEMFKEGKEVQKLSENCRIEHNIFKGIFPVSDRDFCLLQISLKIGNINYLLATSIEHPSVPEVKKPVRATLIIGGWVIEPISSNESKCIYITCSNLNGNILQGIKDKVARDQSMNSVKLKKSMEKN